MLLALDVRPRRTVVAVEARGLSRGHRGGTHVRRIAARDPVRVRDRISPRLAPGVGVMQE